jgi:phenylalanyl-tRNA synthetase beta chain
MFEIAPAYLPRANDLPEERVVAAIVLAGNAQPIKDGETWLERERAWDLRDLQGIVSGLAELLHVPMLGDQTDAPGLHPGRSVALARGDRRHFIGGQLDPRVAEKWELPPETFVAEIDVRAWHEASEPSRVIAPPRYPAALRDLAVVVDEAVLFGDVERAVRGAGGRELESVRLLDVYRGAQIGEGKKSLAMRLVFRLPTGTLSDTDVERVVRRVTGRLQQSLGGVVRD